MGKIIVPGQPDLAKPGQPKQIQARVIFQDENYTIMRNKPDLNQRDILDMPVHLLLIALSYLDANNYVKFIGKENYLGLMKRLKKQFDDNYKKQKAVTNNMKLPNKMPEGNDDKAK